MLASNGLTREEINIVFFRTLLAILVLLARPDLVTADTDKSVIRFGVLSIAPPARIHAQWQSFVHYLSERLEEPVSIIVPRGFGKMRQAVSDGQVDIFYVNSYVFYRLKQQYR